MLNHPTLAQLEELGLSGMAKAFASFWPRAMPPGSA